MGRVGDRVAVRVMKPLRKPENHLRHVRNRRRAVEQNGAVVSHMIEIIIEGTVAILLVITIGLLLPPRPAPAALPRRRAFVARHHRRTDHRDREGRAGDRRTQGHGARKRPRSRRAAACRRALLRRIERQLAAGDTVLRRFPQIAAAAVRAPPHRCRVVTAPRRSPTRSPRWPPRRPGRAGAKRAATRRMIGSSASSG